MAISANQLADQIKDQLDKLVPLTSGDDLGATDIDEQRKKVAQAIATAVVNHLKTSAVVQGVCPTGGGPLGVGKIT